MKLDASRFIKLALIFFGLLFLVCIWLGRRQEKPLPEIEGEKITVEDVEILLDALGVSVSFSEIDDTGKIQEVQENEDREKAEDAVFLTYGQYTEICRQIGKEEWKLPDYQGRYALDHALLKEEDRKSVV